MIELINKDFDPYHRLAESQKHLGIDTIGAESLFIGRMRTNSADATKTNISKLHIEHYPQMTEASLQACYKEAVEKYQLDAALILHRIGEVFPNQAIVLIACYSQHREAAINASRFIIEKLKSDVPLWKKEFVQTHAEWVNKNSEATYEY